MIMDQVVDIIKCQIYLPEYKTVSYKYCKYLLFFQFGFYIHSISQNSLIHSIKLDTSDEDTMQILGMNYLELNILDFNLHHKYEEL